MPVTSYIFGPVRHGKEITHLEHIIDQVSWCAIEHPVFRGDRSAIQGLKFGSINRCKRAARATETTEARVRRDQHHGKTSTLGNWITLMHRHLQILSLVSCIVGNLTQVTLALTQDSSVSGPADDTAIALMSE